MDAIECGCLRHCSPADMEMSGTLLAGMFSESVPFHRAASMQYKAMLCTLSALFGINSLCGEILRHFIGNLLCFMNQIFIYLVRKVI